jgi:hypothetical protein
MAIKRTDPICPPHCAMASVEVRQAAAKAQLAAIPGVPVAAIKESEPVPDGEGRKVTFHAEYSIATELFAFLQIAGRQAK